MSSIALEYPSKTSSQNSTSVPYEPYFRGAIWTGDLPRQPEPRT